MLGIRFYKKVQLDFWVGPLSLFHCDSVYSGDSKGMAEFFQASQAGGELMDSGKGPSGTVQKDSRGLIHAALTVKATETAEAFEALLESLKNDPSVWKRTRRITFLLDKVEPLPALRDLLHDHFS